MRIGAHALRNRLFVAPMAGITDRPFRRLARRFGAALAVSEMVVLFVLIMAGVKQ